MAARLDLILDAVIRPACRALAVATGERRLDTPAAHSLLLRTGAVESGYLTVDQSGGGPAVSWWQIEPATAFDVLQAAVRAGWRDWLEIADPLALRSLAHREGDIARAALSGRLRQDQHLACQLARLVYWRAPGPLPLPGDLRGQAEYWKRHYNTVLGKGTVERFIEVDLRLLLEVERQEGWRWRGAPI